MVGPVPPGLNIPLQVVSGIDPINWSVPAVTATGYTARASTAASRTDWIARNGVPAVLIDCGGQTDLWQSGDNLTAAQTLTLMEAYHDARRAAGFDKTIMCTVPHSTIYDADGQTQRAALNAAIRTSSHWDAVADLAADARLSDATNLTYFEADQLHLKTAGAAVGAEHVRAALASLGIT